MYKRESGESPERYRHCEWERLSETTGKPGRESGEEQSQENCLDVEFQDCGSQRLYSHNETMLFL